MLDFSKAEFDYEPYPIGLVKNVLEPALYGRLCTSYPPIDAFEFKPELGNKYSLSEVNNASNYWRFIESNSDWKQLYEFVKSNDFVPSVVSFLKNCHIDLGLVKYKTASKTNVSSRASSLSRLLRIEELSARFEFSMMDADGGHILPHTDAPQKLITLVLSMMQAGEWNSAWGGGTDVVLPRNRKLIFNQINKQLPFSEVEVLKAFAFEPNQCLIFIKTFNSWHSVSPMRGDGIKVMRKTLTINIERKR
jgi:hypothetical protein